MHSTTTNHIQDPYRCVYHTSMPSSLSDGLLHRGVVLVWQAMKCVGMLVCCQHGPHGKVFPTAAAASELKDSHKHSKAACISSLFSVHTISLLCLTSSCLHGAVLTWLCVCLSRLSEQDVRLPDNHHGCCV
jgi:hypothetical protein